MTSRMPEIGFEVIGNATIIGHDRNPIIVTDPWLEGSAYFGSWALSHEVPEEQRENIEKAPYVWLSHGHPDHLHIDSIEKLNGKTFLLPDHFGSRIYKDFLAAGFKVKILKNREWVKLSDRIKILCIADYNQDGVLLLDINERLVVNLNDSSALGNISFIKKVIKSYPVSVLTMLTGYGDADMINFFDENGNRIPPAAGKKFSVGKAIAEKVEGLGARYFVPSSSMHKYQREDSVWANEYTTKMSDYTNGFDSKSAEILPAFIRFNCADDTWEEINPKENRNRILPALDFGDDWSASLESDDFKMAKIYFKSIEHVRQSIDYINFKVGGKDHIIELKEKAFNKGVTFEVPRSSLCTALRYEIFDDLLIGNFMKTTLHGGWPPSKLYPDFTPYVAKYSDNGRVKTRAELEDYFRSYRADIPFKNLMYRMEEKSKNLVRRTVSQESKLFQNLKRTYWHIKRLTP